MTKRPNPELGIHPRQDTGGVKDAFEEVERHRYANIGGPRRANDMPTFLPIVGWW